MRSVGCQTDVSVPSRTVVLWQCHCPEAATIVDSGDIGEIFEDDDRGDYSDESGEERREVWESQARDYGALDGAGTSANDPRPREEAIALGTEHLDGILFELDVLEVSFERARISSPDFESPVTLNVRKRSFEEWPPQNNKHTTNTTHHTLSTPKNTTQNKQRTPQAIMLQTKHAANNTT